MATVKRFEDLLAWQKSRELTRGVYRAMKKVRDPGFTDQTQRASVSVVSNIAEGFERGTRDTFVNYLHIAKGSCGEVRAQLYVGVDVGYVGKEEFEDLKRKAEDVSKLLAGFIQGVKRSPHSGVQYKAEMSAQQRGVLELNVEHLTALAQKDNKLWGEQLEKAKEKLRRG